MPIQCEHDWVNYSARNAPKGSFWCLKCLARPKPQQMAQAIAHVHARRDASKISAATWARYSMGDSAPRFERLSYLLTYLQRMEKSFAKSREFFKKFDDMLNQRASK